MGHEERLAPPRLSGCCRFIQGTFAGAHGNGRDAPKPAITAGLWNGFQVDDSNKPYPGCVANA